MSTCVLWIDSEHVKILRITNQGVIRKSLEMKAKLHAHNSNHGLHKKSTQDVFFHQVMDELSRDVDHLLIFGPGQARHHFKTYLSNHNKNIYKKILSSETIGKVNDAQLLEKARAFMKKYNLYHTEITSYRV